MGRDHFLSELEKGLKKLPAAERQEILRDFAEHFAAGMEAGKREEEIAAALGDPKQIAREMAAVYFVEEAEAKTSVMRVLRAVGASVRLGFFDVVFVLGPFIGLILLALSGWLVAISFLAAPLIVLLSLIVDPGSFVWFDLFMSLLLAGVGALLGLGMAWVSLMLYRGFVKYMRSHIRIVKGSLERG